MFATGSRLASAVLSAAENYLSTVPTETGEVDIGPAWVVRRPW